MSFITAVVAQGEIILAKDLPDTVLEKIRLIGIN